MSARASLVAFLALGALALAPSAARAQATLVVTKTADAATVSAGDAVGFTITVQNFGPSTATGVSLSDTLPSGLTWSDNSASCSVMSGVLSCSFGSLTLGASASVHVGATSAAANCGPLVNIATASAANAPPSQGGALITVGCPKLVLTPTADSTPFRAGRLVGITLGVTNTGAGTAKFAHLSGHLPKMNGLVWTEPTFSCNFTPESDAFLLSCSFPSSDLKAGESGSVHFSAPTTFTSFFGDATVGPFDGTATASNDAGASDSFNSLQLPVRYPGDVDANGAVNVNDVFFLINFLFAGGPPP
jgi:uncharacterized repeat protein (TIGR01451 family)